MSQSIPSRKQCAHPSCDKPISKRAMYCVAHAPRYPPKPTPEIIAKRAAKLQGKTRSPEICAQMSTSAKKRANTPEGRQAMAKAAKAQEGKVWLGRHHTEESKAIIKAKRAGQVAAPETGAKISAANMGKPAYNKGISQPETTKAKISATLNAKREHLSQKGKERYARESDEQRAARLNPWIKAGQDAVGKMFQDTVPELTVAQWLDTLGVAYEKQKKISYYFVDFYVPSMKLVIEVNGCYWHGCELCGFNTDAHKEKRLTDQRRKETLERKGCSMLVIWEHKIHDLAQYSLTAGVIA